VRADCRIIAATNAELAREVAEGRFRDDLFYRLNVITVTMPPLRDRPEDIPLLSSHFLRVYAAKNGKAIEGFSQAASQALSDHRWPGNIRELEHAVERAVVMCSARTIDVEHLPETVAHRPRAAPPEAHDVPAITVPVGTPLEEVEQLLIKETLRTTGGNKQKAAHLLGIAARTIYRKLGS
jgi:two-component system response regulator HydG